VSVAQHVSPHHSAAQAAVFPILVSLGFCHQLNDLMQ